MSNIRPPRVPFTKEVRRADGTRVHEVTREWFRYLLEIGALPDTTIELLALISDLQELTAGLEGSGAVSAELAKRIADVESTILVSDSARIAQLERRIADLEAIA